MTTVPAAVNAKIPPSPVSLLDKISRLEEAQGRKIIRMDLAEPQFAPPKAAITATIDAVKEGRFRYTSSWGLPELVDEVKGYLADTRGLEYGDGEVLITTGGKFANYAFFSGLLKRGDRVVLLKPYWTSFVAVPRLLGLEPVEVWSGEPYHLNADPLLKAMAKKPKAIVINTPNNPTGGMLNKEDLKILRDLVMDNGLTVLSDEIDWAYAYDGRRHISPATVDDLRESTVVTDGFSKVFAMTGWRVGFVAGPKELISRMHQIQEHSISSPATFAQHGCVGALRSRKTFLPKTVKRCDSNRHEAVKELQKIEGLHCPLPEGGFYVYPKVIEKRMRRSPKFFESLLSEGGVSVVPGIFFGDDRQTFRLSYAMEEGPLMEGMKRIRTFFDEIGSTRSCKKLKKEKE